MYSPYSNPIVNKPRRHWIFFVALAIGIIIVTGAIGFILAMGVSRVNEQTMVKDEIITQNKRLRLSAVDGVLSPQAIATTKSTDDVTIRLTVTADSKDYCIEASLKKNRDAANFHMYKDTPDMEPVTGFCGDSAAAAPATPNGLSVGSVGSASASFIWNPVADAASYKLECINTLTKAPKVREGIILANGNIEDLAGGAGYSCRVAAVNSKGSSGWSDEVNVTTSTRIELMKGLKVSTTSASSISYEWPAVAGAREYVLEYATDPGFSQDVKVMTTTQTKGTISGLEKFTPYFFHVKALTGNATAKQVPYSEPVQGRTAE